MLLKAVRNGLGQAIILADFVSRPRKLQRSAEAQAEVERALRNLSLYQFRACPFCVKTRRAMHRLNLPMQLKDAMNDPQARQALLEGGGKVKVPCLRIEENGQVRWMYESSEIIAYLEVVSPTPERPINGPRPRPGAAGGSGNAPAPRPRAPATGGGECGTR
ncbi:putative glutaredoxin [Pseudomonas aeruginosa]|nr:putative glutaredoxin [Pseudomonas aeruginosa]APJ47700.1 putative glutaredoxin [Pseudomonas aeruginosa]APJ52236.1 putative glutaredoxin [Pseudomonas aeruginosa]CRZ30837.1 glutaredoxin 2 [Pseudomonas aeruginosa DK1]